MKRWDGEIYKENNLRLMKCHIGMAVFYLILDVVTASLANPSVDDGSLSIVAIIFLAFPLFHSALAIGSFRGFELSRKISEFVFALFLMGFPIGTLLSIYLFLPATNWRGPSPE